MPPHYPWYWEVSGDGLEQGDILRNCWVFRPPENLASTEPPSSEFTREQGDVIVLSQTCDLMQGKLSDVLLCLLWERKNTPADHFLAQKGQMVNAQQGRFPAYHLLSNCELEGLAFDVMVVDFRSVYSLPVPFVKEFAAKAGKRCRLLPPYREHLSQAFARFFMRVGLPVDIPSLK